MGDPLASFLASFAEEADGGLEKEKQKDIVSDKDQSKEVEVEKLEVQKEEEKIKEEIKETKDTNKDEEFDLFEGAKETIVNERFRIKINSNLEDKVEKTKESDIVEEQKPKIKINIGNQKEKEVKQKSNGIKIGISKPKDKEVEKNEIVEEKTLKDEEINSPKWKEFDPLDKREYYEEDLKNPLYSEQERNYVRNRIDQRLIKEELAKDLNSNQEAVQKQKEKEMEDLFVKSETPLMFKERWMKFHKQALESDRSNMISRKLAAGRFRYDEDGQQQILPDMDTYGKTSAEISKSKWDI